MEKELIKLEMRDVQVFSLVVHVKTLVLVLELGIMQSVSLQIHINSCSDGVHIGTWPGTD